jgi:hypothetical protein
VEDETHSSEAAIVADVEPVVEMVSNSTEYDTEVKYEDDDKDKYDDSVEQVAEQRAVTQRAVAPQIIVAAPSSNVDDDNDDGGKGLMLSWEEQRKLISARGRKPQHDIGGSLSIKDRMQALNASNSSMGAAMDDL